MLGGGFAVVAVVAGLVLPSVPSDGAVAAGSSASGTHGSAASARAASTSAPVPASIGRAVTGYASALTAAADGSMPTLGVLKKVAADDALDELRAQQLELNADEQHLAGRPALSNARLVRRTRGGTPTARVRACVDSSNVRVVDAAGVPAVKGTTGSQRAVNVYDLRFERGAWRVVRHTFPPTTAC